VRQPTRFVVPDAPTPEAVQAGPVPTAPSPRPFYALGGLLAGLALLIVLRLAWFQIDPELAEFREFARQDRGYMTGEMFPLPRGWITDRHGRVLAGVRLAYQLDVAPDALRRPGEVIAVLAGVLEMAPEDLWARLAPDDQAQMPPAVMLSYTITPRQRELLLQWWARWAALGDQAPIDPTRNDVFRFTPVLVRDYPEGDVAGNVIGFVTLSDREARPMWIGNFGVEEYYDRLLQQEWVTIPFYEPYSVTASQVPLPEPPSGVVLTLDRDVQALVESILDAAIEEYEARRGVIIVMRPKTGEILALAMSPRPRLDDYDSVLSFLRTFEGQGWNWAVEHTYEPGSVMKPIMLSIALDSGAITPDFTYMDTGVEYPCGGTAPVYNWDYGAHMKQDIVGCLANSLNTCFANIAMHVPRETVRAYMEAFGFGEPTGIDLAPERSGMFSVAACSDHSRLGFGYAVSVTPLQLAVAEAAIANGGFLMRPYLVKAQLVNGRLVPTPFPQVVRRVIRGETAAQVNAFLAQAMTHDTYENAEVPGYRLAGKTGTAFNPRDPDDLLDATMVGWGPVDDPQFLVLVWLEDPRANDGWASFTAAPTFRQVVERLVVILGIPPDDGVEQAVYQGR